MTDENNTPEVEETAEATEAAAPGLSIGDMVVLKQCVEVAAARGGFRAEEMTTIGNTYQKLAAFVNAAIPKEEAAEADGEEAVAEEA